MNGTLYGTTQQGGAGCGSRDGCGAVFAITTSGAESVLYSFNGGSDGETPFGSLIALNGKLYGTTYYGGRSTLCAGGCGTVFEVNTSGRERIVYRFRGSPSDGQNPIGALVAMNGELYGATWIGGSSRACYLGCRTIFQVSTYGQERVLYNFNGVPDGENPEGALVNVGGALYGTTALGGTGTGCNRCGSNGRTCGTVFDVSTSGKERLLHRFRRHGGGPGWPLVAGTGLIYGTTFYGGASSLGAVYRLEP